MAREYSTPGVYKKETDFSQVTTPAGTSVGAIVAGAKNGIANARVLVGTDKEVIDIFGKPDADWTNDRGIYGAVEFLKESNSLYFYRATDGTEQYACLYVPETGTSALSAFAAETITAQATSAYTDANEIDAIYDLDSVNSATSATLSAIDTFIVASTGPGAYGNNVGIKLSTSALGTSADWYYNYDANPTSASGNWTKIVKLEVFTREDSATAFASVPVETFYGSIGDLKSPDGSQLNIEQVVNGISKYVYVNNNLTSGKVPVQIETTTALLNGADSASVMSSASIINGWDQFSDRNKVTVNILIGSYYNTDVAQKMVNVAYARTDCIATVQVGSSTLTTASSIVSESDGISVSGPNYGAKYSAWSRIYDTYNDKKILIPNSIYGAVIMARTDRVDKTWKAPAGTTRGILPVLAQNKVFTDTEIGLMYDASINCVKFIKGYGFVLWGQRTAQRTKSALRDINVRRLLLYIENSIEPSLLPFIFENNTVSTRLRVSSIIESFMGSVYAGGGVTDFGVVVDETNNTAQDIDTGLLNISLYLQPSRAIEEIQLNVIITRTGVTFSELVV